MSRPPSQAVIEAVEQAEREHRDTGVREADQLNEGSW